MDDERRKSRATWDAMAPGWERYRDFMWSTTRHVAEWLVEHVALQAGDTILDVAGGPGDNGLLAAERVGHSSRVIVTDFAPDMVAVAERRATALGLSNVEARVLDAEDMDLADDSVDGIVCRWGFMLMLDPAAAMRECRRVLKDGRHLTLSVWAGPEQNPWVTVTGMTLVQLGHQPGGDPFGPGGMFSLSDPSLLNKALVDAGFTDVTIEEMPVVWRYASFDEAWGFMTSVAGAIAAAVRDLSDEEVEAVRASLEENLRPFGGPDGIVLPGVTLNARAR